MKNKLYHLIISRLDGEKLSSLPYQEKIFELVRKGIAGFILFGGKREEIKGFIDKLQAMADVPLFIASDIERGVGQQIKGYTDFPCQMAVRAAIKKDKPEDVAFLQDAVNAIAREAIDVGINMPLIPVLDVNQRPDNPIICTRAFSDNPEDVSWFGSAYIKVLEDAGLISCAKHFPGHGDTSIDSHIALPVITKSYKELMDTDIMPFAEAINTGVSSIMTGHLLASSIDSMPATLSEKMIKGLMREQLGFDGLIITDALNMSALSNIENIPAKCIKAGVDILLHPADTDMAVKDLENALKTKEIDEASIDRAVARILKFKSKLSRNSRVGFAHHIDYSHNRNLSTIITEASITIVKQTAEIMPITNACVVLAGADKFHEPSLWKGHFREVSTLNNTPLFTKGGQGKLAGEPIIFAIFTEVSAWKGSSGITDEERQKIIELIKLVPEGFNRGKAKKSTLDKSSALSKTKQSRCFAEAKHTICQGSIVISFGSPYILSHFKEADMLIAAYGTTEEAQRAVIKGLKGEMEFKGQLPVRLNLAS
ncbi:MAG: hypothetical protein HZB80_11640 [Deltaproteobacteria bacterium]|nr:hypothetical protein [Deltaproteobacteria bacterium]